MNHKFFILFALLIAFQLSAQSQEHKMAMGTCSSNGIYFKMMDTMMVNMANAPHGKTVETEFLYQMMPHHEGAIAMAQYQIRHGKDFSMIQLAKSILQEQKNEVQQMKLWLRNKYSMDVKMKGNFQKEMAATMETMMDHMPASSKTENIDHSFAAVMIPHHQAAIDMARVLLKYGNDKTIRSYALQLIDAQQVEIEQMKHFLK